MKNVVVSFFLLLTLAASASAQSVAHDREARFGKGANLSNWLEAYWMGAAWPQPAKYQRQDLQAMKDAGMSTIRVPFCFAMITDTLSPPYLVDFNSPGIAWLDSVIAWTDALNLNLIVCNQHGWNITNGNYADKLIPMTAMWQQVAQHYAALDPERYFFEMLNEPPVGVLPANADAVNEACIAAVRQIDSTHTLIVGPHTASIGSSYLTFSPYSDNNLIYTFHTYEPLYFTHQGFTWSTPQFPTGVPFPFLGDDALLRSSVNAVADWRTNNGKPVFMGEYGVGIHADPASRCNWITLLGELLETHGFNALAWDWGGVAPSDFSMFDSLPPSATTMVPCFAEAMHFYGVSGEAPVVGAGQDGIRLWPNPAVDHVFVRVPERVVVERVEWWNLAGQRLSVVDEGLGGGVMRLELGDLPKGWLVLRVVGRGGGEWVWRVWR